MRQITLSECCIFNTLSPPHGDTILLADLDEDGYNELCVASSGGVLNIFKATSSTSQPWVQGVVEPEVGEIVTVIYGAFIEGSSSSIVVLVTASSALIVELVLEDKSRCLKFSGVHAPRNVTAGVKIPNALEADVLVVGTYNGDIHIIKFDQMMPIATLTHGNIEHAEATYHTNQGISCLSFINDDQIVVVGLMDGTCELISWPSLSLIQRIDSSFIHTIDCLRRKSISKSLELNAMFCLSNLNGNISLCILSNNEEGSPQLRQKSLGAYLPSDESIVALSQLPPLDAQRRDSHILLALCSYTGQTTLLECSRSILNQRSGEDEIEEEVITGCFFDPAPLFTAPIKCFVAGSFGPSRIEKDQKDENVVHQVDDDNQRTCGGESCLVYTLANGEVLVFHSIASQIGEDVETSSLLHHLELDSPGSRAKLAEFANTSIDDEEALSSTLRSIAYCPESTLLQLQQEIDQLKAKRGQIEDTGTSTE